MRNSGSGIITSNPQWNKTRKTKTEQEKIEKQQKEEQLREWRQRQETKPGSEIGKMVKSALTGVDLHDKHDALAAKYGVSTSMALATHHQRLAVQQQLDASGYGLGNTGGTELGESLSRREQSMLPMSASDGSMLRTYSR